MLQALFAVPVLVTNLGLSDGARFLLRERALNAYRVNNVNLKPWSRSTRESLVDQEPVFKDLFASVICVAETAFSVCVPQPWDEGQIYCDVRYLSLPHLVAIVRVLLRLNP